MTISLVNFSWCSLLENIERSSSMQNIQCLQTKWIMALGILGITILGTLPEFRCWAGGAGSLELRNRILSSFLLTWHLGVLKWQGALHPGSGCSWAVILIVQPLLLYCRWKLGGWKLQLWSEAVRNCRGISLALQCEWQEPHQLDECCGRWPSCLEREMGSL